MPVQLFEGYQRFLSGYLVSHREELSKLAKGQSPTIAMVACCDSRVDPSVIFDTSLGDIFVIRNVANLVPPFEPWRSNPFEPRGTYHGTSAALEFAVTRLMVEHIVILGHARCGGIMALLSEEGTPQGVFIGRWMSIAKKALERVKKDTLNAEEIATACEKQSALLSLENLLTFPWVNDRVQKGLLTLHAWYYDLENGRLERLSEF